MVLILFLLLGVITQNHAAFCHTRQVLACGYHQQQQR